MVNQDSTPKLSDSQPLLGSMLKERDGTEGSVLPVPPDPPVSLPDPAVGSSQLGEKGIVPSTQRPGSPNQPQGLMDMGSNRQNSCAHKKLSTLS